MEAGSSAEGGIGQSGVTTLDNCKTVCRDDDDCVGFDWTLDTSAQTRCWLFSDSAALQSNNPTTGVDHYTRGDCEGKFSIIPTPVEDEV